MSGSNATDKPKALVTAPFRGEGLDQIRSLCSEIVLDPWIDHRPLRLYNSEQLAERIQAEGANLLIVESDSVKGPVLDLPLIAIGSCRGDPTNVDIPGATAKGIPVLRAPGRNADAVAEVTVGLLYQYRAQMKGRQELLYGLGGLFIMGLGIRAVLQVTA